MRLFVVLVAAALIGVALAETAVDMCREHHGFAGESSANFTLNVATNTLKPGEKFVLYARSLSPEGSVQLDVGGRMYAADQPVVTDTLPPAPFTVKVLAKTMDATPFTFVSFVANSEDCRLPLSAANLAVPLLVIDGQAAAVYFYAAPMAPYRFFSLTVSAQQTVTAVYRYDLSTSLENAIRIPTNTPIGGQTDNMNSGVYVAAKASTTTPVDAAGVYDIARVSVVWSVPPPGWQPPRPDDDSWSDSAARAARESGSFFGSFLVTVLFGFGTYMAVRSAYNYKQLGITTYPDFIPHHEVFAACFDRCRGIAGDVRERVNLPTPAMAGVGGSGSAPSMSSQRRGYEFVGGAQP
uniref:Uncharacterized protein n=1 Tax=Neobodo designis TaxID=312471 RepID=A0A6U4SM71_NEODS|mmetsp:Transcript_31992/g.99116  ORF Transcript_31992/g.99116 Transcript_31992/m.99116 type:complete len:352 (+) Transcript_31992:83-1138(+)